MRFLSVTDRELRSAARQNSTHRARWITGGIFFLVLLWLMWAFGGFAGRMAIQSVFTTYSYLVFLYCLVIGMNCTADCISVERRGGTLGLLFLTNLNSAEIVAGKLCSTALGSVYGLLAIFPMLALPFLMGGISFAWFARTIVGLLGGILFALAAGFLASVLCKRQFTAVCLALGFTIGFSGGVMLGALLARSNGHRTLANWLAPFSPVYTIITADGSRPFGPNRFWFSATAVFGAAVAGIGLTMLLLGRTWRDCGTSNRFSRKLGLRPSSIKSRSVQLVALRRRMLAINPLFWLAARERVCAPVIMAISVVLTIAATYIVAPYLGRTMSGQPASLVLGHLMAWLWTGVAIHFMALFYAAMVASQWLAEEKETGALELLLSTPTEERTILRGLWLAYARKMLFPMLLAMLAHLYFIWQFLVMFTLDPSPPVAGAAPREVFWSALMQRPLRGAVLDWHFGFMLRGFLLVLLVLVAAWPTVGWVGRWLGLRMKTPGPAALATLALLSAPPMVLISFSIYLAGKVHLDRLPDRLFLPTMLWWATVICLGHCMCLSIWAATSLRRNLRCIAMSRYQPAPPWRWWRPNWRVVGRFALASAGCAVILAGLVWSYYGFQNWRSERAWEKFQAASHKGGESLDLAALMPGPAPDGSNLARSPAFLALLSNTNGDAAKLFQRMKPFDPRPYAYPANAVMVQWMKQVNVPLDHFITWTWQGNGGGVDSNRLSDAHVVLRGLAPQSGNLRQLAEAAAALQTFQVSTNRDPSGVLGPVIEPVLLLERLHLLFQVRACASLELGLNADAAEDVLTGLRLARFARQLPDTASMMRSEWLLARSLQPIWEGLGRHAWTEAQIASVQVELAKFNFFTDYSNAVRRVVLAHIEIWRGIPDSPAARSRLMESEGRSLREAWELQPRAWWYESCIDLDRAGREAIEALDFGQGRVRQNASWADLDGLPLDQASQGLFHQASWLTTTPESVAFAQTSLNEAILACALERFRLANGSYPESLEQLVPAFLAAIPHDAVSGRPIIYQFLGEGGRFILRGVGPNGTDDRKKKASDDWLWTYSTNTPSAKR